MMFGSCLAYVCLVFALCSVYVWFNVVSSLILYWVSFMLMVWFIVGPCLVYVWFNLDWVGLD